MKLDLSINSKTLVVLLLIMTGILFLFSAQFERWNKDKLYAKNLQRTVSLGKVTATRKPFELSPFVVDLSLAKGVQSIELFNQIISFTSIASFIRLQRGQHASQTIYRLEEKIDQFLI